MATTAWGQVTTETSILGQRRGVAYTVNNALGQTTQVTASADAGAVATVASNASYYPNGGLKQFTYGNGIVHTMTQNACRFAQSQHGCRCAGPQARRSMRTATWLR